MAASTTTTPALDLLLVIDETEDQANTKGEKKEKRKKGPTYQDHEDAQLSSSWVEVSEDPSVGTDQAGTRFWDRISKCYHGTIPQPPQPIGSLKGRWQLISHGVSKFAGVERKARPRVFLALLRSATRLTPANTRFTPKSLLSHTPVPSCFPQCHPLSPPRTPHVTPPTPVGPGTPPAAHKQVSHRRFRLWSAPNPASAPRCSPLLVAPPQYTLTPVPQSAVIPGRQLRVLSASAPRAFRMPPNKPAKALAQARSRHHTGCVKHIDQLNPSGATSEDRLTKALALFSKLQGKTFGFLQCYNILTSSPKWSDYFQDMNTKTVKGPKKKKKQARSPSSEAPPLTSEQASDTETPSETPD
ncbi:uncharacterized protein PGTG_11971 [Puccinia graminis f. sp. tritici CRL 75-36-700-3]|uniref:No apical meristem-associated C-terminal domain-containing protein n=1 Tax=Puccinia graminis f. sp. tritici (strain CRL 75-36-700-3 / race SCCL) TaxID=418459 RepID=E3KNZ0_PUCGT|nr:uncharacterized protein PGTG_11971 [Puccinia graminis f. sp. tritici CRL 75-36-700-3]EFP86015.2 hypothetical protein PGTG_11971 [Puccinia graminis f. sp. tritici CRL 75-36-700-3]